jgi:secretion/DNA translocation related TadE-like protein
MVAGLAAVLVFVTLLAAMAGRLLVDQRRAASAADLAALAGATAVQRGAAGCPAAAATAAANGARLATCVQHADEVDVAAVIAVKLPGRSVEVRASAHAGPVSGPISGPPGGPPSGPPNGPR